AADRWRPLAESDGRPFSPARRRRRAECLIPACRVFCSTSSRDVSPFRAVGVGSKIVLIEAVTADRVVIAIEIAIPEQHLHAERFVDDLEIVLQKLGQRAAGLRAGDADA